MKKIRKNKLVTFFIYLIFVVIGYILVLSFFLLKWVKENYGNIGFEEIMFQLNMPQKGLSNDIWINLIKSSVLPATIYFGMVILLFLFLCRKCRREVFLKIYTGGGYKRFRVLPLRPNKIVLTMLIIIVGLSLFKNADESFGLIQYVKNNIQQSKLIENEYIDSSKVSLVFPEEKRNLICIYVESAETSAQDKENGGVFEVNYIPEMTELAKENISFSQSELIEGAAIAPGCGWTVSGLVAETSGMPLKLFKFDDGETNNSMGKYEYFMPGVTSLGDILEEEGYKNVFMAGSDFSHGGKRSYFTQHGEYEIIDYLTAQKTKQIPEGYRVWWGMEDAKLYAYAKEELIKLSEGDKPFNFSMLTVDTHQEDGYVCAECPSIYDNQYANVWACASKQLNDFVNWIKGQDFYSNTTIVIVGDHCSMDADFYGDISNNIEYGESNRKVYNVIINSVIEPVQEKDRKFTTMDIFPTTLASIGVEIEGNRLGLGTNLFSNERTLSEIYGYNELFEELSKKSTFYNNTILYP